VGQPSYEFADVGAAATQLLKPDQRDPPQFIGRRIEPSLDRSIPADGTGEPKELGHSNPNDLKLA
jgi:hypothetical protein